MKVYVVISMYVDLDNDNYDQNVEGIFKTQEEAEACRLTALREAVYDIKGDYLEPDDDFEYEHALDRAWICDGNRMFDVKISEREIEE